MIEKIIEIFLENPIGQIIWFIALVINVYSVIFLKNNKLIYWISLVSFIWSIHFFLMWLMVGAFINFMDIFKNYLAVKFKKNKNIMFLFIILYIIIWILTYQNIYSILPIIASILWIYSFFFLENIKMKIWYFFVIIFWSTYSFIGHSIWWVIADFILAFSSLIWIYKDIRSYKLAKIINLK